MSINTISSQHLPYYLFKQEKKISETAFTALVRNLIKNRTLSQNTQVFFKIYLPIQVIYELYSFSCIPNAYVRENIFNSKAITIVSIHSYTIYIFFQTHVTQNIELLNYCCNCFPFVCVHELPYIHTCTITYIIIQYYFGLL